MVLKYIKLFAKVLIIRFFFILYFSIFFVIVIFANNIFSKAIFIKVTGYSKSFIFLKIVEIELDRYMHIYIKIVLSFDLIKR